MNELPAGWAETTLEELAALEPFAITDGPFGSSLKTEHYVASGVRVIRLTNVGNGSFLDGDAAYISEAHFAHLVKHQAFPGDLVTAAMGDPLGRTCIVPEDVGLAIVKADCFRLRCHTVINKEYLHGWLNSPQVRESFVERSHGIGRLRINLRDYRVTPVLLPPDAEQRRIVAKLDALSARSKRARAELGRVSTLVARAKQSVLATAFYNPSKNSPIVALREVLQDIRYGTARKCDYAIGSTPVLRIPNVQSGRISLEDLKSADFTEAERRNLELRAGDLLVIRSNGSLDLVGRSAVVEPNATGLLFAGYLIRLRLDTSRLEPLFLQYFLQSESTRAVIERLAKSTSGVNNINSQQLSGLPIPLPKVERQRETMHRIEAVFAKLDRLSAEARPAAALLDRLDQAILAKAFRGELVPQDPDDEPASVLLKRIRAGRAAKGKRTATRRRRLPQVSAGASR
jgi:type I restriction enzyme, S subunit